MHNLIGCFIKEGEQETIENQVLFPFSIEFSAKKTRKYYAESQEDCKKWVNCIKQIIGYASLLDFYELKVFLLINYI